MNRLIFFPRRNESSFLFFKFSSSISAIQASKPVYSLATCIASLQACAHHKNLSKGQQLHSYMVAAGFLTSPLSITSLINMYSKCNLMDDAISVFNFQTHDPNVFSYNAVLAGLISNGFAEAGIGMYRKMRRMGVYPDKFTFPCVIRGCCDFMDVLEVRKIHGMLFKFGLELDVFVGSALVNTYLKLGLVEDAGEVFDELPVRDVVLWNAMVNGYGQIGWYEEALVVFRRMLDEDIVPSKFTVTGVLSVYTVTGKFENGRAIHGFVMKMGYDSGVAISNALIDMYGKCKCLKDALEIFEVMDEKDIFSWNSIISVHEQCGDDDGTLRLFDRMLSGGVRPDLVTVTTVLPACSHLAALMPGREIHGYMITSGMRIAGKSNNDEMLLNNAIMDMYAKCGSMHDAQTIFDQMSTKDAASWNIMIKGYGMHGFGDEALDMFSRMCEAKLKPDEVTFVGVLAACSHAGFVNQGREFLVQMDLKYGVIPTIEHYTCVIDMLGRAGQLQEAYELAITMAIEPNPVLWRALLAACRIHENADMAEIAAQKVLELDPGHCGSYVLMSNVYVAAGRYEDVSEVRHTMKQQNVKKTPGSSWIELNNGVHIFITGDRTHPETKFIYAGLNSLTARMREHGYVPDV